MLNSGERLLQGVMGTILRDPLIFWACCITNLIGAVGGSLLWYGGMLQFAPLWAWLFIPDCPLAALLGSISLLALRLHRRWSFLYALTAFACIKYGIWTLVFWLRGWSGSGDIHLLDSIMFVTHIGLTIEGLLFIPWIGPLHLPGRLMVVGWFVLSLIVDYGMTSYSRFYYGMPFHPPMWEPYVQASFMGWTAALLTTLLGVGLLLLPYRAAHPIIQRPSPVTIPE